MTVLPRVLIVDDSAEDCATYKRYLEQGGSRGLYVRCRTFCCERFGTSAEINAPDCVLLDFNLPDGDGLDFLTQLRKEQGENGPPVVMVTGQGNESVAVQAMKFGAQDYLIKGIIRRSSCGDQFECYSTGISSPSSRRATMGGCCGFPLLKHFSLWNSKNVRASYPTPIVGKTNFLRCWPTNCGIRWDPFAMLPKSFACATLPLPDEAEQAREIIDRQVAHMVRLIDDLLDVSRIVRGKVLLRKEPVDLGNLIRSTICDHRGELDEAGLKLVLDVPESQFWVNGDPTRLAQILGNILDNARKFTPQNGTISVSLSSMSDRTAVLRVIDSGEGIDPTMLEQMFEVFSQADRSLDRSRGGLGLGLAIVKGLAELHDGEVTATSKGPGSGCEIAVALPLIAAPTGQVDVPEKPEASSIALRVLVIEDNLDAAECLKVLLRKLGHQVALAHTGHTALETAREFHPELVLCDIGLADGMDGYVVAERFRGDPTFASTFLVALTGYGREEDQKRASDAGFDLHLTKPVAFDTLKALPNRIAERS